MSIIGALPVNLTNGTVADATQVMSDLNWIQSQVNGNACPATSGTSLLAGDGAGGTTPAATAAALTITTLTVGVGGMTIAPGAGLVVSSKALTTPIAPAFSATPTFDASTSNVFAPGIMTANITSMTISNFTAGQIITIRFKQDATGGRTVAVPTGAKIAGIVGTLANQASFLTLLYNTADSRFDGAWLVLPV